jgi:ribonuclease HII
MDPFDYDESVRDEGFGIIGGIDEAGRGPLAGPVVAAVVILPRDRRIKGVRDSKTVPAAERERLFKCIMLHALEVAVGIADSDDIDRLNILQATKVAMTGAVGRLKFRPDLLLIDAVMLEDVKIAQRPLIKGDATSASIAAASIVAKVVRDRIMDHYHTLYRVYGFHRHKGYATRAHIRSLREHGPCPIHRKSFHQVMTLDLPFSYSEVP